jgi:hypothetical protein
MKTLEEFEFSQSPRYPLQRSRNWQVGTLVGPSP